MAYELHIKRESPITIDEWVSVVKSTNGLKIDESDSVAINPITNEEIRIPGSPETVALWFSDLEEWIKVFRFRRGQISFKATDWENENSPVRLASFALAEKLNAEIFGDEGEKY
ncbi:hypothetical protein BH10ACI1_BH10ACI1_08890 [soil metagenome]